MGKQMKKVRQTHQKKNKWQRVCERCGNETFSPKKIFQCQFCGLKNGIDNG